jgi:hypothetical protein
MGCVCVCDRERERERARERERERERETEYTRTYPYIYIYIHPTPKPGQTPRNPVLFSTGCLVSPKVKQEHLAEVARLWALMSKVPLGFTVSSPKPL